MIRSTKELMEFVSVALQPVQGQCVRSEVLVEGLGFRELKIEYVVELGAFEAWGGSSSSLGLKGGRSARMSHRQQ